MSVIIVLLGWVLAISGLILLVFPEKARKAFLKKSYGKVKKMLLLGAILLSIFLITLSFKIDSIYPKIVAIIAIVGIIKLFFSLKEKAYEHLSAFISTRPVIFLRGYALLQIAVGVTMIIARKKMGVL